MEFPKDTSLGSHHQYKISRGHMLLCHIHVVAKSFFMRKKDTFLKVVVWRNFDWTEFWNHHEYKGICPLIIMFSLVDFISSHNCIFAICHYCINYLCCKYSDAHVSFRDVIYQNVTFFRSNMHTLKMDLWPLLRPASQVSLNS